MREKKKKKKREKSGSLSERPTHLSPHACAEHRTCLGGGGVRVRACRRNTRLAYVCSTHTRTHVHASTHTTGTLFVFSCRIPLPHALIIASAGGRQERQQPTEEEEALRSHHRRRRQEERRAQRLSGSSARVTACRPVGIAPAAEVRSTPGAATAEGAAASAAGRGGGRWATRCPFSPLPSAGGNHDGRQWPPPPRAKPSRARSQAAGPVQMDIPRVRPRVRQSQAELAHPRADGAQPDHGCWASSSLSLSIHPRLSTAAGAEWDIVSCVDAHSLNAVRGRPRGSSADHRLYESYKKTKIKFGIILEI